ncbi:uncharacterized protein LOC136083002 [Hydra vulgaris]|uniref:Uncharacterized protein LOC136083002 n=1 Tax=Hydra vulgaris TaxID=6087 RepID=A0ABM4C9Y8_HYDVU
MALLPTMPHKNFAVIVKSCKINGVKMIKRNKNGASGREFVKCIAMAVREKCSNILKEAQFFSILCDASQARKTKKEKELVLARIERCGSPFYMVLDLFDIDRGFFRDLQIKKVDEFYNTNFYLLRNSGKIKQEVINASAALGTTQYTLPKLTGTRFVGHHIIAFKNLLESWPAYIVAYKNYVNERKNPITTRAKGQGLLKKFKSYNFLCTVAVYHDLLELNVPASKVFEANELLPHEILAKINQTNLELELKLEEIDTDLEFLNSNGSRYMVIEGKHNLPETLSGQFSKAGDKRKHPSNRKYIIVNLDMTLVDVDQALCLVRNIKRKVIPRLINTLDSRFTSIKEESEIYHAMRVIDPQN